MTMLGTHYLGMDLKNPLVASASPMTGNVSRIRELEDSGIGAVVLPSLFEEQIMLDSLDLDWYLSHGTESFAEALTYLPDLADYQLGPEAYLKLIEESKAAVDIPVIASLNGASPGGWVRYASQMQAAGADAIELNIFHIPTDPQKSGIHIEQMYLELVTQVKQHVSIPVAVKLSPYFSSMAHMGKSLEEAGADALVLFNRFYQPDFDLENLEVVPDLVLSDSNELRLRLLWVAVLSCHVKADLAVTGGVHTAEDVLKSMMAGARVAMLASGLLKNGTQIVQQLIHDLQQWIIDHEYVSIHQMQGSMNQQAVNEPEVFERVNYLRVLRSYTLKDSADRNPGSKNSM